MILRALATRGYIFKYMNPSFISEESLDSGKQMGDMYYAMLWKILWAAECLTKSTKQVSRLTNVEGAIISSLSLSSLTSLSLSYLSYR